MPTISFRISHNPENKEDHLFVIFAVGRYPAERYPTIQQYEQSALLFLI